ncbi:MAG: SPFH domain-containing protein [Candidatus Eisenbacteria bacterium]
MLWVLPPFLAQAGLVGLFVIAVAAIMVFVWISGMLRYVTNSKAAVAEKLWSPKGSITSGIIALNGEAGFQPDVLRGGLHVFTPFQYRVRVIPLVTIPQGKIGYVFARDGEPLPATQALARAAGTSDFQDVRVFLQKGGQRGPQRVILREGTYAINLAQFVVITSDGVYALALEKSDEEVLRRMAEVIKERRGFEPIVIKDKDDLIGIVTVHDGPSLQPGQIIAPTVGENATEARTYHNNFQDPERFLAANGQRGRQLQVLVEGTYYINRLFATVEMIPKTVVPVGSVGVVVSYTGETGSDVSGVDYSHGELVASGLRGVWRDPLLPGKYAFNTYAGSVLLVPTTNFILKWMRQASGSDYDQNLAEVALITKDAFEPSLPLSVVVHIDYRKAPLVVQRFGDIKRLVEQTLDPMVAAYFKNVAQTRTVIELLQDRASIQQVAGDEMKERFAVYNLELQEVLIGTPTAGTGGGQIEQILTQLRSRQIAEEQVETYNRQEKAAVKERELREAESRARQQQALTESEISIAMQMNQGKAELARAEQEAARIQTLAQAEAERTRFLGEGEAKKIRALASADAERAARIGVAQALAIEEQVRAYGGPRFQLTQQVMNRFAEAIEGAKVDVVPKVVIGGGHGENGGDGLGGGNNVLQALLALLLSEKMGVEVAPAGASNPEADALRQQIRAQISAKDQTRS